MSRASARDRILRSRAGFDDIAPGGDLAVGCVRHVRSRRSAARSRGARRQRTGDEEREENANAAGTTRPTHLRRHSSVPWGLASGTVMLEVVLPMRVTFTNKADPADPDERAWPAWASVLAIGILALVVAMALLYRLEGSLLGLDGPSARALVVLLVLGLSGLAWWMRRRRRLDRSPRAP